MTKTYRSWGKIKKQPTAQPSFQASFIGPDGIRHYAPIIFGTKINAEGWLSRERDYKERCAVSGERWKPPKERAAEKKAEVLKLTDYGKSVIDQRTLKPRTRIEYESKWSQLIEPKLGKFAVSDLTPATVRKWFSDLGDEHPTRNGHAYAILNTICNTAVRDGLLDRNPCDVRGAMNPKTKKVVKIPTTVELHGIADKLGADERTARFRALVLLAGWCGMRFGEVSELRRKDFDADCTVVTISRAKFTVEYPASFMLVAAMNPCPCGFYNHPEKECVCAPGVVQKYLNRISGPLLDRIDIHIEVTPVAFGELSSERATEKSADVRERVIAARRIQEQRFTGSAQHCNAQMSTQQSRRICRIDAAGQALLEKAMERLGLSARAYDRILKVARTIADLDNAVDIRPEHLAEAIQYRSLDREGWAG